MIFRTRLGREIRAVSDRPDIAAMMGIRVKRVHLIVAGLSAGLAAIAGVLLAMRASISPFSGVGHLLIAFEVPVLVGLAAIPVGLVMFPLKHAYFAIGMWVVAEIAQQLTLITPALGRTGGLTLRPNGQAMAGYPEQIVLGICVFGSVALIVGLRVFLRTRTGLATLAMRDNPEAAASAGVDIRQLHLIIFAITAAGTALAGALYYSTTLYTSPLDAFQVNRVVSTMFIVVIGGLGTLTGPIIGTVQMITLREVMTAYGFSGDQYWIVMGLIAMVTLLFLPRGLWPAFHDTILKARGTA